MKTLTNEQDRVFSFIVHYQKNRGAPPTVREICTAMGYQSINNVRQHLRLIAQKGYIRLTKGMSRGIELLTQKPHESNDQEILVPLLGSVAAGQPITAHENIENHIVLDKNLFRGGGELFSLRIKGDSMKGIGVLHGDFIIVKQQSTAEHNDIVVAIIDGDATLKRFLKKDESIILHPENPAYNDIVIPADRSVTIAGKMIGIIRKC